MFLAAIFNRVEFIASNQMRRLRVFPRFAGQVVRAAVRLLVVLALLEMRLHEYFTGAYAAK